MSFAPSFGQIVSIIAVIVGLIVVFYYRHPIKKFLLEVAAELKKVSWTTRKDLVDSTWVVIVSSACLGLFIGVADFILSRIMSLLIK